MKLSQLSPAQRYALACFHANDGRVFLSRLRTYYDVSVATVRALFARKLIDHTPESKKPDRVEYMLGEFCLTALGTPLAEESWNTERYKPQRF